MRKPAKRNSSSATGMSATSQVTKRFPVGSRICVNIQSFLPSGRPRIIEWPARAPSGEVKFFENSHRLSLVRCNGARFSGITPWSFGLPSGCENRRKEARCPS